MFKVKLFSQQRHEVLAPSPNHASSAICRARHLGGGEGRTRPASRRSCERETAQATGKTKLPRPEAD